MRSKIAYLTIDDAPSKDFRKKVDYLCKKKIPAVFFCEGRFLEKRMNAAVYGIKKGFILGNHAYNHPHFSEISLEACFSQIRKTDKLIETAYKKAGAKRPVKVFRFPYLDKGWGSETSDMGWPKNLEQRKHAKAIQDYLRKMGYKQPSFKNIKYKWYLGAGLLNDIDVVPTYDTHDYAPFTKNPSHGIKNLRKIFERMDEDFPEQCRGLNFPDSSEIIMVHDYDNEKSARWFPKITQGLLKKGLIFHQIPV